MLKTYEIKVQVPKIVVTVNALNGTKARKLALEIVRKQLFGIWWPNDRDLESITIVSKLSAKKMPRKSKDYMITFTLNNGPID